MPPKKRKQQQQQQKHQRQHHSSKSAKPSLVVIGGGWAGFELINHIDYDLYDVTVISPQRNTTYTPLLASAATGLFNFSLAEEPIRSKARSRLHYLKAAVTDIDLELKECTCQPAFNASDAGQDDEINNTPFTVKYDLLVIAPGMRPNDFGTEGVSDHALFLGNVSDAIRLRKNLFDLLEKVSLPTVDVARRKELLHIAVVGGGPTGVELVAELDDLFKHELLDTYPDIAEDLSISLYDVAPNILPMYEAKLHEYATKQLEKRQINVSPDTKIEKVDEKALHIKDKGRVPYGMLVWATGNTHVGLIDDLEDEFRFRTKGPRRILTDAWLRVLRPRTSVSSDASDSEKDEKDEKEGKSPGADSTYDDLFGLGDCADIAQTSLPPTAEVAVQKARYLASQLNRKAYTSAADWSKPNDTRPFKHKAKKAVSYIGQGDGVASDQNGDDDGGSDHWTGSSAWLAWRGSNVMWVRSWRARVALVIAWVLNWLFGREVSRI